MLAAGSTRWPCLPLVVAAVPSPMYPKRPLLPSFPLSLSDMMAMYQAHHERVCVSQRIGPTGAVGEVDGILISCWHVAPGVREGLGGDRVRRALQYAVSLSAPRMEYLNSGIVPLVKSHHAFVAQTPTVIGRACGAATLSLPYFSPRLRRANRDILFLVAPAARKYIVFSYSFWPRLRRGNL